MQQSIEQVASLRAQLWDAGFRPVPIYNPDAPGPSPGKRPWGEEWQINARRDPPFAAVEEPRPEALNTGILCDGLRAIDIDVDNPTLAHRCRSIAISMFGEAPVRTRRNSSRCLILYRAAEGMPRKASVTGSSGKVEVLGQGQQFVAFGRHHEGAVLEWTEAPGQELLDSVPAVAEDAIAAYLAACAPIIGAKAKAINGVNGHHVQGEAQADPLRIAVALAAIPNRGPADWDYWNRVGMATWRASSGSNGGFEAFKAWSSQNPCYDDAITHKTWAGYASSPPTQIGAGTIFFLADDAKTAAIEADYAPLNLEHPPETPQDAGYRQSVEHDASMSGEEWNGLKARESGEAIPASEAARAAAGPNLLWSIIEPWDAAAIPTRPWIARGYLMRRALSVISGPGSAGKSSLMVAWASALAIGCAFNRLKVSRPMRVLSYNVEDDEDEQKRRFSAFCMRLGLDPKAFAGNLAIVGPTRVGTLLHTARDGQLLVNTPVMDKLETFVDEFRPDVLMLDPFVELHSAEENDNTAVRAVLARLRSMANQHEMASAILHHSRKAFGKPDPGDPDSLRGASAIVGAARVVLTVNVMSKDEAALFGITEEKRRNYFRLDGAKNNYAPIELAEWFERIVVKLPNGSLDDDNEPDGVAAIWPWNPPKLFAEFPPAELNRVLDEIDTGPEPGERFSPSSRGAKNGRWVGQVLMDVFAIPKEQAAKMISTWISTGLITKEKYTNGDSKEVLGIFVNATKRPSQ
jgi:hypothetical protein